MLRLRKQWNILILLLQVIVRILIKVNTIFRIEKEDGKFTLLAKKIFYQDDKKYLI